MLKIKEKQPFGVYFHWPYCQSKCPYCDFLSVATPKIPRRAIQNALLAEWARRADEVKDGRLVSVHFGGGTPSIMKPQQLQALLGVVWRRHSFDGVELAIEVNPSSALPDFLSNAYQMGINRLSIGVQSFNDDYLKFLGRIHTAKEAITAIETARMIGFSNIGVDLIVGGAAQTKKRLCDDIETVLRLRPEHVSIYMLTIEGETQFQKRQAKGEALSRDDETMREYYIYTRERLIDAGYEHYEISNFALKGKRSVHNRLYWSEGAYLGIGPSAHSYTHGALGEQGKHIRRGNIDDIGEYIRRIEAKESCALFQETLQKKELIEEAIITRMRRMKGISAEEFRAHTGEDLTVLFGRVIEEGIEEGVLQWLEEGDERRLALTLKGILVSDSVFLNFLSSMA